MSTRRQRTHLGVSWALPGAARPFTTTTRASSDLLRLLATDNLTWAQARDSVLYDPDAKAVCAAFVDAGHGDVLVREHVEPYAPVRALPQGR